MAKFRSYAQPGQFRGSIKTPDKATAKRKRDEEFVTELKEEKQALWNREQRFIQAMEEKLRREQSSRDAVEQATRESVEAERKQRVINAQLEADYAEQKMKVDQQNMEVLASLVPSIAQGFIDATQKRKEYDEKQAYAIFSRAENITAADINEWRSQSWTAESLATTTHVGLRALLDSGKITAQQFLRAMDKKSAWGIGLSKAHLDKTVNRLPDFTAGELPKQHGNITLFEALHSNNISYNDRILAVDEHVRNINDQHFADYNPVLVQEHIGKKLDHYVDSLRKLANDKGRDQAVEVQGLKDEAWLTGALGGKGDEYKMNIAETEKQQGQQAAYIRVKKTGQTLAALIANGTIGYGSTQVQNYLDTRVYNNGSKEYTTVRDHPNLHNPIIDAGTQRTQTLNTRKRVNNNAEALARKETTDSHIDALIAIESEEEREQYIQHVFDTEKDPRIGAAVKEFSGKFSVEEKHRNDRAVAMVEEQIAMGIPPTKALLETLGIRGEALVKYTKQINAAEKEGVSELEESFSKTFDIDARRATNTPLDGQKMGQGQLPELRRMALNDYRTRYKIHRNQFSKEEAHKRASNEVMDDLARGIDKDNPQGLYAFDRDESNPFKGRFRNIGKPLPSIAPLDLAKQFHKEGNNVVDTPGAIWPESTLKKIINPNDLKSEIMNRASQIALVTPDDSDTGIHVLIKQMIATNVDVPTWLSETGESHTQLIQENRNNKQALIESSKAGELSYTKNKLEINSGVAVTPIYTGDTDGRQTGTNFRLRGGQGAEIRLPFDVTIVQSQDGFPTTNIDGTIDRRGASGSGFGHNVGGLLVTLPNGEQVELMLGHLNGVSPLAGLPIGTLVPAGTLIGSQGASGRSVIPSGLPWDHISAHADGVGGYTATENDLMFIVNAIYNYSRGSANVGGVQVGIRNRGTAG